MAIASICEHCGSGFSAPDASLGSGVTCPTCGKKTKVHDQVGAKEIEEKFHQEERRQQEYQKRLSLLKDLEERDRGDSMRGGIEAVVRNFQPRVGTRNRRLRLLGNMLMVIAWTILIGSLVLALFAIVSIRDGDAPLMGLALVLMGIFGFSVVKFLSEASHSMAEMADR